MLRATKHATSRRTCAKVKKLVPGEAKKFADQVPLRRSDYTIMNKTLLDHTNVYTSSEYVSMRAHGQNRAVLTWPLDRRRVVATAEIFTTCVSR